MALHCGKTHKAIGDFWYQVVVIVSRCGAPSSITYLEYFVMINKSRQS